MLTEEKPTEPHSQPHPYQGTDPIVRSRVEAESFNQAWLTSKKKLKPVETIGFTIINLVMILGGIMFAQAGEGVFAEISIFSGLCMLIPGMAAIALGIAGLFRVYRSL